jgi:hypothetical protein
MIIHAPTYQTQNSTLYYCPECNEIIGVLLPCKHFISIENHSDRWPSVILEISPETPRSFNIHHNCELNVIGLSVKNTYHRQNIIKHLCKRYNFFLCSLRNLIIDLLIENKMICSDEVNTELASWFVNKIYNIITNHVDNFFFINAIHNKVYNLYRHGHKNVLITDIEILPAETQLNIIKAYCGLLLTTDSNAFDNSISVIQIDPNNIEKIESIILQNTVQS